MKYLLFAVFFSLLSVVNVYTEDNNYVPGEIIVMIKPGEQVSDLTGSYGFYNMTVKEPVVQFMNIWLVKFDNGRVNNQAMLNEVRKHPSVSLAQFNHYVTDRSVTPNDTRFAEHGH